MALSIGTLVGYLQLDDTQFTRKADAADKKINGLKLHLDALAASNPKLKLQVETQTSQLDALQARIADLKAQSANGIDVRVDMVAALVELDRLQAKLRSMHNAEIKVHVDDAGALAKLDAIQAKAKTLGGKGGLFGSALAFTPAFLPMLNAIPGGLFAIGSGAVASAGGIGVLALAFHGLGDSVKAYQDYEAKLPFAKNAKQIAELKKTLALSAYGEQNSAGREFTRTVATKGAHAASGIKSAAQAGVFPGATKALNDIMPLVPVVERLMRSLGHTVGDMTDETAKALNSPFWRQWFHWLGEDAKTQLPLVGSIFGHFFEGLMHGIERFAPQGTSILKWFDDLAKRFDNWTGSPQFDKFMATTAEDAHLVGGALQPLGKILSELYQGMSGAGTAELQIFGEVLSGMAHLPPGVFKIIGATLPIIFLGLKAVALTNGIVTGIRAIGTAFTFMAEREGLAAVGIRSLAGAGGLGLLALSSQATNKSLGALGDTAGGAMIGFAAGGPWGAALGAGAGALYGLSKAMNETDKATTYADQTLSNYVSTLRVGQHAITGMTRAMAVQEAQKSVDGGPSLIKQGQALGVSPATVVSGILGQTKALAQLKAMQDAVDKMAANADGTLTKAQYARYQAVERLTAGIGIQTGVLKQNIIDSNTAALAMRQYAKVFPGIPHKVATEVSTIGLENVRGAIVALTKTYHLTPKQVRTILTASGETPTIRSIQRIIAEAKKLTQAGKNMKVTPGADGSKAKAGLSGILADLINAAKTHAPKVTPTVAKAPAMSDLMGLLSGLQGYADGHPVTIRTRGGKNGKGHASGGTVEGPRTPYGDKVLTPTAPGEEIVSNSHGQADRNRAALKAANAGATLAVVGGAMAGGGTVGDPLAGFGPGDVPGSGGGGGSSSHHHGGKKKHHGQTRSQKLHAQLTAENKALSQTRSMLAQAQEWSSTFGGNAFSADLSQYMPAATSAPITSIINGMKVVQSGGPVAQTPQNILTAMLAYQNAQKTQAMNLATWVKKLRGEGVSKGVLAQMQAAGPQGIAQIQALASGTLAQVHQFNASQVATTGYLNNTGALATSGQTYSALQQRQMALQDGIKLIDHLLKKPIHVTVDHGHVRV